MRDPATRTRTFLWLQWGFGVSCLLFTMLMTSSGLENLMDIRFYDESYYLCQGLFQPVQSWLADYSPLYSLYYLGLSLFEPDAIALYYLNYRIWALIFGFSILVILVRFGVDFWFATLWAIASISSQLNYPVWPKSGHLAMLGVAICLVGLRKISSKKTESFVWISGICFALSWCRPEFLVGGFLAAGFLIFQVFKFPKSISFWSWWIFIPWLTVICFTSFWGLPFGQSGRGMVAFGQHFVHNHHIMQGLPESGVASDWVNWKEEFEKVFDTSGSLLQAFLDQPLLILKHIWFNVKHLIYNGLIHFFETLFPFRWFGLSVLMCVGVLWIAGEWLSGSSGLSLFLSNLKNRFLKSWASIFCLAVSPLTASIIFQPRTHYYLPLFPVFLVGIGAIISGYHFPQFTWRQKQIAGILTVILSLCWLPKSDAFFEIKKNCGSLENHPETKPLFSKISTNGLKNRELIADFRKIKLPENTRIFDGSTGVTEFLGTEVIQTGKVGFEMDYPRLTDFLAFLERENVSAVYLAETMKYDHFFFENKYFQTLKSRPELEGWRKSKVGFSGDSLLVKIRKN